MKSNCRHCQLKCKTQGKIDCNKYNSIAMYVYWSKWRKEWVEFKNQPPSKGELIQMEKLNYKTKTT